MLRGPYQERLHGWIVENDPALRKLLGPKLISECRHLLNERTGLNVLGTDLIEDGSRRFLEALMAEQDKNSCPN